MFAEGGVEIAGSLEKIGSSEYLLREYFFCSSISRSRWRVASSSEVGASVPGRVRTNF